MKNRLLEDFGDSQSAVPVRPVRRVQAAPPPAPQPQAEAAPSHAPAPAARPEAPTRQRAGVWRSRASVEAPVPPRPRAEPAQSFVPPRAEPTFAPPPAPEPPRASRRVTPEIASFSSREPDWSIPLKPEPAPWTERWGRKALGWTIGLAVVVAAAGTAAWMVQETRVESTLAVVADHTPAQATPPAPAVLAAAPVSEPDTETLPPLKLLPRDPAATAPAAAEAARADQPDMTLAAAAPDSPEEEPTGPADAAPATVGAAAAAAATATTAKVAAQPPAKKPEAKRAQERRVAAAPAKRTRPETKKPPKPARERAAPPAPAVPARTVSAEQPDPESPLAETLRLCRAAGYHATACLKRGCEATRFGLVCRG